MGFSVLIGIDSGEADKPASPAESPLQSGFIDEGCASGPTGAGWYDSSTGVDYGHGTRYDSEEARYITKVPSKNK